jgi:hypothetical protein
MHATNNKDMLETLEELAAVGSANPKSDVGTEHVKNLQRESKQTRAGKAPTSVSQQHATHEVNTCNKLYCKKQKANRSNNTHTHTHQQRKRTQESMPRTKAAEQNDGDSEPVQQKAPKRALRRYEATRIH